MKKACLQNFWQVHGAKVWRFKGKPKQYFSMVMIFMLLNLDLTFESVHKILKCDYSNESYWAVLSCGAVNYVVQSGFNFSVCGWNPKVWTFKWKLLSSTFLWYCLLSVQSGSSFWVCGWNPKVWPFKWKLLSSTFLWCGTVYMNYIPWNGHYRKLVQCALCIRDTEDVYKYLK